jgi:plasmid stabilization system protein ParE
VSLPVVWIPEADADLKEALAWYECINPDLGLRFLMATESAVEIIAQHPLRFQTVHNQMRRIGIRRFPYGIFFQAEPNRIVVLACIHGRRNPKRWKVRRSAD